MPYTTTHTVYFNKDNIEVPSVTTILKILNKPAIIKWANSLGFRRQNVDDILAETSEIGTIVHKAIYCYLMDYYFIFISGRFCSKIRLMQHLNNFFEWKKEHTICPIFMEKQYVSDKFGGTVDFYGIVDDKLTILDFKTSKRIYSTMFLQLAAYCIMLEEQGEKVEQVGILIINEQNHKSKFITREELQPYIDTFKKLVDLFHSWYDLNMKDGWGEILK